MPKIAMDENLSPVLYISGMDMMNGTPVYDIKPYIPVADCKTEATDGFTADTKEHFLNVNFDEKLLCLLPHEKQKGAVQMLKHDPRPSYIDDENRVFGVVYAGYDLRFTVSGKNLTVREVIKTENSNEVK